MIAEVRQVIRTSTEENEQLVEQIRLITSDVQAEWQKQQVEFDEQMDALTAEQAEVRNLTGPEAERMLQKIKLRIESLL